jgi:hypothetical protein
MTGTLADFIHQRQSELIERWMTALREAAAGAPLTREQLEDKLLAYLRRLTEALADRIRAHPRRSPRPGSSLQSTGSSDSSWL